MGVRRSGIWVSGRCCRLLSAEPGRGLILGNRRARLWALQDNFFAFWDDENGSIPEGGIKNVEDATGSVDETDREACESPLNLSFEVI